MSKLLLEKEKEDKGVNYIRQNSSKKNISDFSKYKNGNSSVIINQSNQINSQISGSNKEMKENKENLTSNIKFNYNASTTDKRKEIMFLFNNKTTILKSKSKDKSSSRKIISLK